jgi:hypothetical protein
MNIRVGNETAPQADAATNAFPLSTDRSDVNETEVVVERTYVAAAVRSGFKAVLRGMVTFIS